MRWHPMVDRVGRRRWPEPDKPEVMIRGQAPVDAVLRCLAGASFLIRAEDLILVGDFYRIWFVDQGLRE